MSPTQFSARPRSASTGETLVPKSRIRKKADYTPPPAKQATALKMNSRAWVAPVMLALFAIGLAWIVVFYVTDSRLPIEALGNWNIVVGFGFIAAGFGVSTQWK
nr:MULTISPECIES: cell division protein CrgA [unclassified Streptomyces]